jgi:hypothetical protein
MYILVHRAVLTKKNTALSLLFLLLFASCGLFEKGDEIKTERITFTSHAIESVTNVNGELDIETVFNNNLNVLYDIMKDIVLHSCMEHRRSLTIILEAADWF